MTRTLAWPHPAGPAPVSWRELIMKERRPPHHDRVRFAYRDAYLEPPGDQDSCGSIGRRTRRAAERVRDAARDRLPDRPCVGRPRRRPGRHHDPSWHQTGRAIMVWPPAPGDVEWPPVTGVGDDALDAFTAEVAPWRDDSPCLGEWRAIRRVASASGLPLQERSGSETQPDVGSRLVSRLVSQTVLVARLLPARDSRCSSFRAATL